MTRNSNKNKAKLREFAFKIAEYQIKNDKEDCAILIEKVQGERMSTYAIKLWKEPKWFQEAVKKYEDKK